MTSDEIRAFVRRFVEAWEQHDIAAIATWYAEDCEVHSPMFGTLHGRAGVESSLRDLFRIFSDWKFEVDELLIDHEAGDKAAFLARTLVTHRGELFAMPGTGRRVENRVMFLFKFADGQVVSETRLYDFTGLLVQLGVLKARTA
jgi:steroid delta-isomerase-like uncharacterized protein